jgi:hypothetical protein
MTDLRRIVWLASFPKSGNTWLRAFLANYFQPPGKTLDINSLRQFTLSDIRQDFFDKANGRPYRGRTLEDWIRVRPAAVRLIAGSKSGHHFVKTHCQIRKVGGIDLIPPEVTAAAIYILRNPFDIAPSYARHLSVDLDAAIERMGSRLSVHANPNRVMEIVGRWDEHIGSWTNAPGLPRHVMRYEDMLADPDKAFRRLLGFLRLEVDESQLTHARDATSFDKLQKQEQEQGFRERPGQMGVAGGWRDALTPQQVAKIRSDFLLALERWYPEMLAETQEFAAGASS